MTPKQESRTEQTSATPFPTEAPRDSRSSLDQEQKSYPSRARRPSSSGYIPDTSEKPPLNTHNVPPPSRGHRRGPSTDSKASFSSQETTSSVLSRTPSRTVNKDNFRFKEHLFDSDLSADGDAGELDEQTRNSLFKDEQPTQRPSWLKRMVSRESVQRSSASDMKRTTSRDSTTSGDKPPSLLKRARKISGDLVQHSGEIAKGVVNSVQNVAATAQNAAHRLNTQLMSRPERAEQSRRYENHRAARAALAKKGLRRTQSTSHLDARFVPSKPTTIGWEEYQDARDPLAWKPRYQPQEQSMPQKVFSPFAKLAKKVSKQNMREVSSRNNDSPDVRWVGEIEPLPAPRSSSRRNPHAGPDRPESLVASVYGQIGPQHKATPSRKQGESVGECMDRVQAFKNTSVQGRVREEAPKDIALRHQERLEQLKKSRRATESSKTQEHEATGPKASTSTSTNASRPSNSSSLANEITVPPSTIPTVVRSPSTKFPAKSVPNVNVRDAKRITRIDLPAPEQSVPSSPNLYPAELDDMCKVWTNDGVSDLERISRAFRDDDRKSWASQRPTLRRFASESDIASCYSESEASMFDSDARDLGAKLWEAVQKMNKRVDDAIAVTNVQGFRPHPQTCYQDHDLELAPGDTVVFDGRDLATPTASSVRASAPWNEYSAPPVRPLQVSKTAPSARPSEDTLSRSSKESLRSTAPSVPPKDPVRKPTEPQSTPAPTRAAKSTVGAPKGSVREIASRFEAPTTTTASSASTQRPKEVVSPPMKRTPSDDATKSSTRAERTSHHQSPPPSRVAAASETSSRSSHNDFSPAAPISTSSRNAPAVSSPLAHSEQKKTTEDAYRAAAPQQSVQSDKRARRQGVIAKADRSSRPSSGTEGSSKMRTTVEVIEYVLDPSAPGGVRERPSSSKPIMEGKST
ncbi:hypothetical protein EIP86_004931 [Pleurotus ostreatoroseus]|nr:hypothetical protein EIP86_004931 [Pleurotus ostreatoroseus]